MNHIPILSNLLPEYVGTSEQFGELSGRVFPEEAACIGTRAVVSRKIEFASGRSRAHEAMALLGIPVSPIVKGPQGEPLWPDGVIGSITHCPEYCAAAVARKRDVRSIGIDAEVNVRLPADLISIVARRDELDLLRVMDQKQINAHMLLFCIKEAVYKAWYPTTHSWLNFHEVKVRIAPEMSRFTATVRSLRTISVTTHIEGSYAVGATIIAAALLQ